MGGGRRWRRRPPGWATRARPRWRGGRAGHDLRIRRARARAAADGSAPVPGGRPDPAGGGGPLRARATARPCAGWTSWSRTDRARPRYRVGHPARGLPGGARPEPAGRGADVPGRGARHAFRGLGPDRGDHLARGPAALSRPGAVHHGPGRRHRFPAHPGPRGRRRRGHRELGATGLPRHRPGPPPAAGTRIWTGSRPAGWAAPRTSGPWSRSSAPSRPTTSPAPRSRSTAAPTRRPALTEPAVPHPSADSSPRGHRPPAGVRTPAPFAVDPRLAGLGPRGRSRPLGVRPHFVSHRPARGCSNRLGVSSRQRHAVETGNTCLDRGPKRERRRRGGPGAA